MLMKRLLMGQVRELGNSAGTDAASDGRQLRGAGQEQVLLQSGISAGALRGWAVPRHEGAAELARDGESKGSHRLQKTAGKLFPVENNAHQVMEVPD